MWVRRRRRRRILAGALALAYFFAFALLASPLWRPADAVTEKRAPVLPGPADHPIGIAPLASSRALPESLPGSNEATVTSPEADGTEVVHESETEAPAILPEAPAASAGTPPSDEPNQSSETIIAGEG